ncbi:hypothetical protein FACS1894195_2190 [Bacteroidia bacterium]|nr:hypothetical protein FACS1894195_2190 [Bacteroidia bacterium]
MDFRKYFASISHAVLKAQLRRLFKDPQLLALFDKIIDSYETTAGCGIPIGNLTSQYFANYYLSALDHYAKEVLQIPVYIRYMDDILILENDKAKLHRYNHLLARGLWDERTYQQHIIPLIAFANWAYTKQYYNSLPN